MIVDIALARDDARSGSSGDLNLYAVAVQLKFHFIKIGVIHPDYDIEVVAVDIMRRIIAHPLGVSILIPDFPHLLGTVLGNIQITAGDLGEGEYIGIGLGKIPGAGDHK